MIALNVAKLKVFFAGKRNFSLNKAKKKKKKFNRFVESVNQFRHLEVPEKVNRGYYMAARRKEISLRVLQNIYFFYLYEMIFICNQANSGLLTCKNNMLSSRVKIMIMLSCESLLRISLVFSI